MISICFLQLCSIGIRSQDEMFEELSTKGINLFSLLITKLNLLYKLFERLNEIKYHTSFF